MARATRRDPVPTVGRSQASPGEESRAFGWDTAAAAWGGCFSGLGSASNRGPPGELLPRKHPDCFAHLRISDVARVPLAYGLTIAIELRE